MLSRPLSLRYVLEEDEHFAQNVRIADQAGRLELFPAIGGALRHPGVVDAKLVEQTHQSSGGVETGLVCPVGQVLGVGEVLDDRKGQRHGTACSGLGGRAGEEVTGLQDHRTVECVRGNKGLEGGLDVERQAGRAALVRFEAMAEAAVVVAVAAQRGNDARSWRA